MTETSHNTHPVDVTDLSRRFKRVQALDKVTLHVPKGQVFGLVGENGAGKTTFLKHLLGLYRAMSGTVRVFGMDPVKVPEKVLARIGYLSEDRDLPDWMRISELMWYQQSFYPSWDETFADELLQTFGLDPAAKVGKLSRGKRAQAGLLIALAHRPDLLILDEPSSGLDPVVRRDILSAIIRTVADEGRTLIFSSHLLDEVERVADSVAMINNGAIAMNDTLENIRTNHHCMTISGMPSDVDIHAMPGVLQAERTDAEWEIMCDGAIDAFKQAVTEQGGIIVDERSPSLDDVFVVRVKHGRKIPTNAQK